MKLLASYFPFEMSRLENGEWTFSNRHGYPVGINLSDYDEGHWNKRADQFPAISISLKRIDDGASRRLSCPEWRLDDGSPLSSDVSRLYDSISHPGAKDENMDTYLGKLEILIGAGALRTLFPYGMQLQKDGSWVFFNRNYNPVGTSPCVDPGSGRKRAQRSVAGTLPGVTDETLSGLHYTGIYDEKDVYPGMQIHLYDEFSTPTDSSRNLVAYVRKLRTVMTLDGLTLSKLPMRARALKALQKTRWKALGPLVKLPVGRSD